MTKIKFLSINRTFPFFLKIGTILLLSGLLSVSSTEPSVTRTYSSESTNTGEPILIDEMPPQASLTHEPIFIDGDDGGNDWSTFPNKTGSGTFADPYVIENFEIDAGGVDSGIFIQDSDVYVEIISCTLSNAGNVFPNAGIRLLDCTNIKIINCTSNANGYSGIILRGSSNNTLSGNNASYNNDYGIYLYNSNDNILIRNHASHNLHSGIQLYISDNATISENNAHFNTYGGIWLDISNNNTVLGNYASQNGYHGFYVIDSSNNTISGNFANYNTNRGIYLWDSNYNTLTGNTANYNIGYGIKLETSNNNTLLWNIASHNTYYGVALVDESSNNTIYSNIFLENIIAAAHCSETSGNLWDNGTDGNYWGGYQVIYPDATNDGIVWDTPYEIDENNTDYFPLVSNHDPVFIDGDDEVSDWDTFPTKTGSGTFADPYILEYLDINAGGTGSGIFISNSSVYAEIINCEVFNAGSLTEDAGIRLTNCSNIKIINCTLEYNENFGIYLSSTSNTNTLSGNTVNNNNKHGINLNNADYNTLVGNTANSNLNKGIRLGDSNDNTLTGNTANYNEVNGILVYYSSNNIVSENTANYNNENGIVLYSSSINMVSGNTANHNNETGIYSYYSHDNNLSGNIISSNDYGIKLDGSNSNLLVGNNVSYSEKIGIELSSYNNENTLSGNIVCNTSIGISLYSSSNHNILFGNMICNTTSRGIILDSSDSNLIYFNMFLVDYKFLPFGTSAAYCTNASYNSWDNGTHGNYWGDYQERYPSATNDGIFWNTPYEIDAENIDNFPLVIVEIGDPNSGIPIVYYFIGTMVGGVIMLVLVRKRKKNQKTTGDQPVQPAEPLIHEEPETPAELDIQEEPITPAEPKIQEEPITPSEPEIQEEPITPTEPEIQEEPVTLTEPEMQEKPVTPTEPTKAPEKKPANFKEAMEEEFLLANRLIEEGLYAQAILTLKSIGEQTRSKYRSLSKKIAKRLEFAENTMHFVNKKATLWRDYKSGDDLQEIYIQFKDLIIELNKISHKAEIIQLSVVKDVQEAFELIEKEFMERKTQEILQEIKAGEKMLNPKDLSEALTRFLHMQSEYAPFDLPAIDTKIATWIRKCEASIPINDKTHKIWASHQDPNRLVKNIEKFEELTKQIEGALNKDSILPSIMSDLQNKKAQLTKELAEHRATLEEQVGKVVDLLNPESIKEAVTIIRDQQKNAKRFQFTEDIPRLTEKLEDVANIQQIFNVFKRTKRMAITDISKKVDMPREALIDFVFDPTKGLHMLEIDGDYLILKQEKAPAGPKDVTTPKQPITTPLTFSSQDVKISRGGDWRIEGNQSIFHFKVKILNKSAFVITQIQILLTGLPRGLEIERDRYRIESLKPQAYESPTFKLKAKESCVGDVIEGIVIFNNPTGQQITENIEPFEICYVCNLLVPKLVSKQEFDQKTELMAEKHLTIESDLELSDLERKIERIIQNCNFALLQKLNQDQGKEYKKLEAFAEGLYDKQDVGLTVALKKMDNGSQLVIKAMSDRTDKITDLLRDFNTKLDDIKSDTELIKEYTGQIEALFDQQADLEVFLRDRLQTDFDSIKEAWQDYKNDAITKKELIVEGVKIMGRRFIALVVDKILPSW